MRRSRDRRLRRKKILRRRDGSLYDVTEDRRISAAELRDHVRSGGFFEARRYETGEDCTYELLPAMMGTSLLESAVPGYGGGSALGPLAGLSAGSGLLGALTGRSDRLGGLGDIARVIGDEARGDWTPPRSEGRRRSRDGDWDDWAGRSRRSEREWDRLEESGHRARDRGWDDHDDGPPRSFHEGPTDDWDTWPRRSADRRRADDWADPARDDRRRRIEGRLDLDDDWGR